MVDIFNTLEYTDEVTLNDWNNITRDVFFQFFDSEEKYLFNKESLRTELVNYIKHIAKQDDKETLFKSIYNEFKKSILNDEVSSIKELSINFLKETRTDSLYMNYYISQPNISNFTSRDLAIYYFDILDKILEGCFKPRLELFYKFYYFNLKSVFPNIETKTFGDIVNLIDGYDSLLKDPFFNISISQWRNIAAHKSFIISKSEIVIKYGKVNKKTVELTHQQLKDISFWINNVYGVLRLPEVLIYLNYMEQIMDMDEAKNSKIDFRSEPALLGVVHNAQIVGFEFESFDEIENTFELNLYNKSNDDMKESIIHASQAFTQIAIALDEDDFQKEKFEFIKVNIIDKNKTIVASAIIDMQSCIDFSYKKIDMEELIKNIEFKFHNQKVINK